MNINPQECTDSDALVPSREVHPVFSRGVHVEGLLQRDRPEYRAGRGANLLVRMQSPYLSMVRLANTGHGLSLDICVDDSAPETWRDDASYWARDLYKLSEIVTPSAHPSPIGHAVEVTATAPWPDALRELGLLGDSNQRWGQNHGRTPDQPVPMPVPDNAEDLLGQLRTVPGAVITYLIQAATELERSMVTETLSRIWVGDHAELHAYNACAVRFRMFLAAPGPIPDRLKAELRSIATHIDFRDMPSSEWKVITHPSPSHLAGHVVPLGTALSLLRLPAAGRRPFPGIATIREPSSVVPIDPVPTSPSDRPIRLGQAVTSEDLRTDVAMGIRDMATHVHLIGQPGSGKTTLLVHLQTELARQGIGFASFSSHHDLRERVSEQIDPAWGFTLWSIDHGDSNQVVPVNPLAEANDGQFAAKVTALTDALKEYIDPRKEGMFGERATAGFVLGAEGCRKLGLVSIPMVTSILSRQDLCDRLAKRVQSADSTTASRIRQELVELSGSQASELFSWQASRYTIVHSSPLLMRIIGTGANAVDMIKVMDQSQGLAVNLGATELGVPAAQFLLALWLIQIRSAMLSRRHREKPFVLILDEAHAAAFGPLASMLDEARKFGVYIVIAHQRIGQLSGQLADALEADTGTFIALRCGPKDAARAAARLRDWPVTDLTRMPTFQAAAIISLDGIPTEPFTLRIDPPASFEPEEAARRNEWRRRVEEASRAEFSEPYAHLEAITPDNIQMVLDKPIREAKAAHLSLQTEELRRQERLNDEARPKAQAREDMGSDHRVTGLSNEPARHVGQWLEDDPEVLASIDAFLASRVPRGQP